MVLDQGVELRFILADVAKRPFITAGMTAFLLMFPLAATSTRGAIRRLGRRWQVLHRLVYISAAAAALHFIWKVKVVAGEPIYYGVALILLLRSGCSGRPRRSQPSVANPLRHNVLAAQDP